MRSTRLKRQDSFIETKLNLIIVGIEVPLPVRDSARREQGSSLGSPQGRPAAMCEWGSVDEGRRVAVQVEKSC